MKMKTALLILVVAITFSWIGYSINQQNIEYEDLLNLTTGSISSGTSEGFSVATTNTSTSISTASSVALGTNYGRIYARISNNSDNLIWCSLGTTALVNEGIPVYASSSIEFGRGFIPATGQVTCIAEIATSTVYIVEK